MIRNLYAQDIKSITNIAPLNFGILLIFITLCIALTEIFSLHFVNVV